MCVHVWICVLLRTLLGAKWPWFLRGKCRRRACAGDCGKGGQLDYDLMLVDDTVGVLCVLALVYRSLMSIILMHLRCM
jgi:hypothetical protein